MGAVPSRLEAVPLDEESRRALELPDESMIAGSLRLDLPHRVAIVGTRQPNPVAEEYARTIARDMAKRGIIIVSGGARGIDRAAHEGALDAGGVTWIVLPSDAPKVTPPDNDGVCVRAIKHGAVIWPFGSRPQGRGNFHGRNRVLVRMSAAVIVVQAGLPSGTLNAAHWANEHHRPLWVALGAPFFTGFEGSIVLLKQGARPLYSHEDVLADLGVSSPRPAASEKQISLPFGQDSTEAAIWACLSQAPKHQENIAVETGIAPFTTQGALLTLTLENVVVEGPPGFFRRAASARSSNNR